MAAIFFLEINMNLSYPIMAESDKLCNNIWAFLHPC